MKALTFTSLRKAYARIVARRRLKKLPPKVKALARLLKANPDLLAMSDYDKTMREWWAKHPPKHRRPTPYPRIGGHAYG